MTTIKIIFEGTKYIDFTYNGFKCRVMKNRQCGWTESDTRWLCVNNVSYDGIGFDVEDGYAVSNGISESYIYSDKRGICMGEKTHENENIHDVVEIKFPTMKEILSNWELFCESLYYVHDLGEHFEDYLKEGELNTFHVSFFFEGFFFGGCTSPFYKVSVKKPSDFLTQKDAEKELFKCLENEEIGDRVYEFAQDLFNGYVQKIEANKHIEKNGEDDTAWYDDCREDFFQSVYDAVNNFLNK